MPGYHVHVQSAHGRDASRFTLDDDRPLVVQLPHVLHELRQRDVVVHGAPGEQLIATCDGIALDLERSPRELGIVPETPIELRMAPTAIATPIAIPRTGALSLLVILSAVVGGGAVGIGAWTGVASWAHAAPLSGPRATTGADAWSATLLALGLVVFHAWTASPAHARSVRHLPRALALGTCAAAVSALAIGATLAAATRGALPFGLARLLAWTTLGACIGLAMALAGRPHDVRHVRDAVVGGLAAGIVATCATGLPSGDVGSAIAFLLFGVTSRLVPTLAALRRAPALVVALDTARPRIAIMAAETAMTLAWKGSGHDHATIVVRHTSGASRLDVLTDDERRLPPPSLTVAGRLVRGSAPLVGGDVIDVAGARYLFVTRGGAGA